MKPNSQLIAWLLEGDASIRWQTQRDFKGARKNQYEHEQKRVETTGWGAALLKAQDKDGNWGGGVFNPRWTSTTYTMALLRRLGLPADNKQARAGCKKLIDTGHYKDGGINFSDQHSESEPSTTGIVLAVLSYFEYKDNRLDDIIQYLIKNQAEDGSWTCRLFAGDDNNALHTTINILEGLREFEMVFKRLKDEIHPVQEKAHEFLLSHELFKKKESDEVAAESFLRFSFPPRSYYDVLRALDYLWTAEVTYEPRMNDAVMFVKNRMNRDGTWTLQQRHSGKALFELEQIGKPSRWNTLRALRVLRRFEKQKRKYEAKN